MVIVTLLISSAPEPVLTKTVVVGATGGSKVRIAPADSGLALLKLGGEAFRFMFRLI